MDYFVFRNAPPSELEQEELKSTWLRNSLGKFLQNPLMLTKCLAPSDGYNPEREFGQIEGVVFPKPKGNYKQWSHLMTKKQLNPEPNFTDVFFIFIWKFTNIFFPLAGFVSKFFAIVQKGCHIRV